MVAIADLLAAEEVQKRESASVGQLCSSAWCRRSLYASAAGAATSDAVEIPIASQSSLGMSTLSGEVELRPMFASAAAM